MTNVDIYNSFFLNISSNFSRKIDSTCSDLKKTHRFKSKVQKYVESLIYQFVTLAFFQTACYGAYLYIFNKSHE